MRVIYFIWTGMLLLSSSAFGDTIFTLENYLEQVQSQSPGLQGAMLLEQSSTELTNESFHLFAPTLFANYENIYDKRPTLITAFQGTKTTIQDFRLGMNKQTNFGLNASAFYDFNNSHVFGVDPLLYPQPHQYVTSLNLQLTQSFLQNGFGRGTNATINAEQARNIAEMYQQRFQRKQILMTAQIRYWQLSIARALVIARQQSLDRTKTFQKLNEKRARLHLIDDVDLTSIIAAVQQRQLELTNSVEQEKVYCRAFNESRNINTDRVPEELTPPAPETINQLPQIKKTTEREDAKAAQANVQVAEQTAIYGRDQRLPKLDAFANFSTNGLNPTWSDSNSETFDTNHPLVTVGGQLSVPLDFSKNKDIRRSYLKQIDGAKKTYQQSLLEDETSWTSLNQQWSDAKVRLGLAIDLRGIQAKKLEQQRRMQQQGKSTTYQVFLFEQDLLDSELLILQTEELALNVYSQMKTYEE